MTWFKKWRIKRKFLKRVSRQMLEMADIFDDTDIPAHARFAVGSIRMGIELKDALSEYIDFIKNHREISEASKLDVLKHLLLNLERVYK